MNRIGIVSAENGQVDACYFRVCSSLFALSSTIMFLTMFFFLALVGSVLSVERFPSRSVLLLSEESSTTDSSKNSASAAYEGWTSETTKENKRQSPTTAMFKSIFVPGLGQIGNRKYVKAVLVIGGETFLFLRWLDFRNQTVDARSAFEAEDDLNIRGQLFGEFDAVRDKRNLSAWLTGALIFVSMIDAFVDAHLAQFPSPNSEIALGLTPTLFDNREPSAGFTAKITWSF